ncbi:MAG: phage head-tail connector protein [Blautia sp.]
MTELEKIKKLTGDKDEELLQILVEDATVWVLAYTNRTRLVSGLDKTVRDLAVIALNRIGTEGESARTGSGESYTFDDAPRQIYDVLNRYRLARVGGVVHETQTEQTGRI